MSKSQEMWDGTPYPDMIRNLPEIDIPIEGIRGWLLQNDSIQSVYFDIQPIGEIPPHSHCDQWGVVLEGEMRLTIDGETKTYRRGDRYFIPEGVVHSAIFLTHVHLIDYFNAPDRYGTK